MLITTRAIVLKTIRHSDSTVVLRAWTEHAGLRAYLLRAGGKRGAAMAALQPLNRLELVVSEHAERDLHSVRELRVAKPYTRIPLEAVRGSVALFVQEVLYKVLRQESADPALDAFIADALEVLDTTAELSHFPLIFLLRLSGHLGFFPETPSAGDDRFDLREGHFTKGFWEHAHTLGPPHSLALAALLEIELGERPEPAIPASQRRILLDYLLLYYRMHLEGLGELRSPEVLHQVLG